LGLHVLNLSVLDGAGFLGGGASLSLEVELGVKVLNLFLELLNDFFTDTRKPVPLTVRPRS